ncbi:MAG: DUF1593 domain-containing protein [Marinilabilia sp.]
MKSYLLSAMLLVLFLPVNLLASTPADSLKPRIIVLTDISPNHVEPDDMESLIRLLVHADLFEIEGLVATTGWSSSGDNADWERLIHEAIDAYEEDLPNLRKRSGQNDFNKDESQQKIGYWPSPDYLRARTVVGSQVRGIEHIGEDNNSPGSNLIIEMADQEDDRPVWVLAWGGGNTLAQAIWQVQQERSDKQFNAFLDKLRAYTITDQDRSYKDGTPYDISSHQWMRRKFKKDLFFIWDECAWKFQNGTGKENWDQYATHIQGHGTLGSMYPKYKYGVEGDTPSFLYVLPNGLNYPENPGWGSWGGYFEWAVGPDQETYAYTNHGDMEAYSTCRNQLEHFYPATFNNFAARMDWADQGKGNRNPVVVVNDNQGLDIINMEPGQGKTVTLDASKSFDPDDDQLTYKWWVLSEAGTYSEKVNISGSNTKHARIDIPSDSAGETIHVICEVEDKSTHNLTSYRRIIIKPKK